MTKTIITIIIIIMKIRRPLGAHGCGAQRASLVFLPFCTILELPILSSCILWSSDLSFPVFWSPSNLFTGCQWAPAAPIYLKLPCPLGPGTPSQIPYLQHISHIRHIWPPCHVIWRPWKQKVFQITSIGSQNGANFDMKNRPETDFKAKMQNITKHHYLLCSVKVSHLKNTHIVRYMGS